MAGRAFVSRFSPNRTDPALLEAIFVQRHKLADVWLKRLRDSIRTKVKHHLLAVGPRGCGKSHLVALLVGRLRRDAALLKRVRIAWLPEDETTPSFWKFLLRILRALTAEYGDEFPPPPNDRLASLSDENRAEFLTDYVLKKLDGRTLLVVVENLDDVMKGLKPEGQKRWRAFLQTHPVAATLGTAQQLTEDLSDREKPFFNFFQIEHLKALSTDEALLLLRKIAEETGKPTLARFLDTPTGRARVKAIRHIAGGSHRIFIILSEFVTRESLDDLVTAFDELLDELTPYYQERLRWLPDQQREIVEFLCRQTRTVQVKEIAAELFLTDQTTAAQLKSLRDKGYVRSESVGRESRYELAEPLMRLCVEVKDPQREPIRLIVEFLRIWYDRSQLESRLQCLPAEAEMERRHFLAALLASHPGVPSPVEEILDQELTAVRKTGNAEAESQILIEIAATTETAERAIGAARRLQALDRYGDALEASERAIERDPKNASAWALKGFALMIGLKRYSDAVGAFERATDLEPESASYWSGKGLALQTTNNLSDALRAYDRAIDLAPNAAWPWVLKGTVLTDLRQNEEAKSAFSRVVKLAPNDHQIWSLFISHLKLGRRYEEALSAQLQTIEMAPDEASLWVSKGDILSQLGRNEEALAAYDQAIAIGPPSVQARSCRADALASLKRQKEALAELERAVEEGPKTALGWEGIGSTFAKLNQNEKALMAFNRAIEMAPQRAPTWRMKGVTLAALARVAEARVAFDQAIELAPDSSSGWACRGRLNVQEGQLDNAIDDLLHAIRLNGNKVGPFDSLAEACILSGRWPEAEGALATRFRLRPSADTWMDLPEVIAAVYRTSSDLETWETRIRRMAKLANEANAGLSDWNLATEHALQSTLNAASTSSPLAVLGDALVRSLTNRVYVKSGAQPLDTWADAWRTVANDYPDLSLAVRLFGVGIRYLQTNDERVLLDLVQEERSILRELFLLDANSEELSL